MENEKQEVEKACKWYREPMLRICVALYTVLITEYIMKDKNTSQVNIPVEQPKETAYPFSSRNENSFLLH